MNFQNLWAVLLVTGNCFLLSVHGIPLEAAQEIDSAAGCGALRRHINIDTWINEEMYQKLIELGFPVEQKDAISELNHVASIYAYPTEFIHGAQILQGISLIDQESVVANMQTMSEFHSRHYLNPAGLAAADWIFNKVQSAISGSRLNVSVARWSHTWEQYSIIAKIEGRNPSAPIVILGAHFDSTAGNSVTRSPGADDNASGAMTVLETLRIMSQLVDQPEAGVEFHWYAAEEVGLLGAKNIANTYRNIGIPVAAMLNYDMIGYAVREKVVTVVTDFTDPALSAFLRLATDTFASIPWKNDPCGYGCSDHAAWTSAGFPASYIASTTMANLSPYYHTARDEMTTIDFNNLMEFVKVALATAIELSAAGVAKIVLN